MSSPSQASSRPDADRYGAPRPVLRVALIAASVAVVVTFLLWLAWSAWSHSTPAAGSELLGFDVVDQHRTTAIVDVAIDPALTEGGAEATCRVKAFSEDHSTVGEVTFTPEDGRNDVVIRTERRATSVESVGCTTPDQQRPR